MLWPVLPMRGKVFGKDNTGRAHGFGPAPATYRISSAHCAPVFTGCL